MRGNRTSTSESNLSFKWRLKTITSAPSLIELVLKPLPSESRNTSLKQ